MVRIFISVWAAYAFLNPASTLKYAGFWAKRGLWLSISERVCFVLLVYWRFILVIFFFKKVIFISSFYLPFLVVN